MQIITNYQMSVFGDYMSYEPTLERMNALAKTPPELNLTLLPTIANIISYDVVIPQQGEPAKPKEMQRLQMVDTSRKVNLAIMPERIDINFSQPNSESAEQLDEISARARALLKHTISILEAKYWRIAINLAIQMDDESGADTITKFYNAIVKPLLHQNNKEIIEWQIMSNCPQTIIFGSGRSEQLNVITNLSRQTNVITMLDVNTSAINRSDRFDDGDLEMFYLSAIEIIKKIITDIEEKWKNA